MKKTIFLSLLLLFSFSLVGCLNESYVTPIKNNPDAVTKASPRNHTISLDSVEIQEYNGEKLDLMADVLDLSIKGPQQVNINTYELEITGFVEDPKNYTYDEVLQLQKYSKVVTLNCVTGWSARVLWEGVLIEDIFDEVKVKSKANTVIFHAYDGYTTSLPLQYILDNEILMADKINNVTLIPERGFPFQLVAEDKYGYKWIKWITKIELSDNADYQGYWESRGYDNKADIK